MQQQPCIQLPGFQAVVHALTVAAQQWLQQSAVRHMHA
jgi:hypothetical protein